MQIRSVVIIGSGHVATCMGVAFASAGIAVRMVFSPQLEHAQALAGLLQAPATDRLGDLPSDAGLYLVAVKDEAIAGVALHLQQVSGLVVHTSGSTALDALSGHKRHGVFYALQSFNKHDRTPLANVPFLVEAALPQDQVLLAELAALFSADVRVAGTVQRQSLHVAAVFANNFTNHLYAVAKQLLDANGLPFDLLKPLIRTTAEKALTADPAQVQTGPAARNDRNIIDLHLRLLLQHPQWKEIYEVMSKSISAMTGKNT